MFSGVDIPACDRQTVGQTDRQTSCDGIVRAMHTRRAVKMEQRVHTAYCDVFSDFTARTDPNGCTIKLFSLHACV